MSTALISCKKNNIKQKKNFIAISREDNDDTNNHHSQNRNSSKMPYNGYSDEYLDRLETNGNIQADNKAYSKRKKDL